MREDEDQFRYYVPLLRRIIILVAVITAIPVILWTITAFVRTYVAPPKVPTFRPMTATASIAVPPVPDKIGKPPAQGAVAQPPSPMPEGRAAANDAPGAKGPLLADRMADVTGNAGAPKLAELAPAAPADATPPAADGMTPGAPNASPPAGPATTAQMPPPMDAAADTLPAAAPLSGPVPLPRHRPRNLDVAQLSVPVPRPRPGAAGEAGSDTSGANPLEWIRSIFQPQQSQQQSEQQ
jgi:hypothetical protein